MLRFVNVGKLYLAYPFTAVTLGFVFLASAVVIRCLMFKHAASRYCVILDGNVRN